MYVTWDECGCFHCVDCIPQPPQAHALCHNQVVTRGCRIQSHLSPTESVLWHNDCYDNHHLKPRVGGGEMSASRLLLWWSHFWLAGTTRSKHPNWQSGCHCYMQMTESPFPNNYTGLSETTQAQGLRTRWGDKTKEVKIWGARENET